MRRIGLIWAEQAETDPYHAAWYAWLILLTPPPYDELVELDRLIVRLCYLVPWARSTVPELLAVRRDMAPTRVAEDLAPFRAWVSEAETDRADGVGRTVERFSAK